MHSDGRPDVSPRPVLEVAYFAEEGHSFVGIVRGIGVLALLIGVSMLIYVVVTGLPTSLAVASRSRPYAWMGMIYYIASVAVAIVLIVAAIGCMAAPPRGRGVLIAAAWGLLLVQVYGVVATIWMLTRVASVSPLLPLIASHVQSACATTAFPVILLVLTRHPSIRDVFESA